MSDVDKLDGFITVTFDLNEDFDLSLVPGQPGVYCFLSRDREYLYIGKAKILRNRIASYLRPGTSHQPKTALMLKKAKFLDIFLTGNEKEALILEAQLIGDLKPKYNIRLRDDKAYPFIRIGMKNRFPRIGMARRRGSDDALYFGPFTSSDALRKTLSMITNLFRLRTCSDNSMKNRARPCLKYQIGKCSAPCTGMISAQEYRMDVESAMDFLRGKTRAVLTDLKAQMDEAAMALEFERAAVLRDRIRAIEGLLEKQRIISEKTDSFDVIFIASGNGLAQAVVLHVREGILRSKESLSLHVFDGNEERVELYTQFVKLYYRDAEIPVRIVLPEDAVSSGVVDEIQEYLRLVAGHAVKVVVPRRGEKVELLAMARLNAVEQLSKEEARRNLWRRTAILMKESLGLDRLPSNVEGIDISNTSGLDAIGSLVCFRDGLPFKDGYRQFGIHSSGPDDYGMIAEVMKRRFKHTPLPDLFIIDGGPGQLSVAEKAVREAGVSDKVDLVSIAKERHGEGDRLYVIWQKEPICLPSDSMVLRFCQRVRDEAHRFGVYCHRKKRTKKALSSILGEIKGVGPKRRSILLRHFGSLDAIERASVEELSSVPGISRGLAKEIYSFFRDRERIVQLREETPA